MSRKGRFAVAFLAIAVGLAGIGDVLRSDDFTSGLWITIKFMLYTVPAGLVVGVLLATAAHRRLKGIKIFQTIFSSTIASSVAVSSVVFLTLVNKQAGYFQNVGWLDLGHQFGGGFESQGVIRCNREAVCMIAELEGSHPFAQPFNQVHVSLPVCGWRRDIASQPRRIADAGCRVNRQLACTPPRIPPAHPLALGRVGNRHTFAI